MPPGQSLPVLADGSVASQPPPGCLCVTVSRTSARQSCGQLCPRLPSCSSPLCVTRPLFLPVAMPIHVCCLCIQVWVSDPHLSPSVSLLPARRPCHCRPSRCRGAWSAALGAAAAPAWACPARTAFLSDPSSASRQQPSWASSRHTLTPGPSRPGVPSVSRSSVRAGLPAPFHLATPARRGQEGAGRTHTHTHTPLPGQHADVCAVSALEGGRRGVPVSQTCRG